MKGDIIFEYETKHSENYESRDGFYPVFLGTKRFEQTLVYLPIHFLEEIPPWTILTLKFKNHFCEACAMGQKDKPRAFEDVTTPEKIAPKGNSV